MIFHLLSILGGLVLLTLAADRLALSAAGLARVWGVSPVAIGAIILGFGTSTPELLVSALAASRGQLDLSIGNVVGSNVVNVTLVLGIAALVAPLQGHLVTLRREGAVMVMAVTLLVLVTWGGALPRPAGWLLLGALLVAGVLVIRWGRGDEQAGEMLAIEVDELVGSHTASPRREILIGALSLVAVLAGAELLLRGAGGLATTLGISGALVGLSLVAVGTSLPELATSLAAARRGEQDLVLGNVLGSNLFNSLGVAGTAALVGPGALQAAFEAPLAVMLATCGAAWLLTATGNRLGRTEAILLLSGFGVFLAVSL